MASIISAGTSTGTALNLTGDTSGQLALATNNGTTALTIDTSQNVGIGNAVPTQKLDVYGNFRSSYPAAATYVSSIFENQSSTGYSQLLLNVGVNGANGQASISYAPGLFLAIGTTANDTTTPLVFRTSNATERMRILTTGNILSLAGGSTSATGTGIAFPATQSASSDANTLDDYEEGTFTLSAYGQSVAGTPATTTGTYIKIGRLVYARWNLDNYSRISGGSGNLLIGGLPFTIDPSNTALSHNPIGLFINGLGTGTTYNRGAQSLRDLSAGGTVLLVQTNNSSTSDVSNIQISDLGTTYNYLRCDFVYQTTN